MMIPVIEKRMHNTENIKPSITSDLVSAISFSLLKNLMTSSNCWFDWKSPLSTAAVATATGSRDA